MDRPTFPGTVFAGKPGMKTIMKFAFSLLFLLPQLQAHAQSKPYDDLLILYVDEDYEKCIQRAERHTEHKDSRRDPLPYLYASMCYFEISKIPKYQEMEEYRRADRDALKWAAKYRRKDKNLEFFANYEDYWRELNTVAQEVGLNHFDAKEYSKARSQFQRITRYNPENPGAWQMLALAQSAMKATRDAAESKQQFQEALDNVPNIAQLPQDQRVLLREGLIRSAEHLLTLGKLDSARTTVEIGSPHFLENPEFRALYEEVEAP